MMKTYPPISARTAGFTLVEFLTSLLLFGVIIAGTLSFLVSENRALRRGFDESAALQNLRYTLQSLESSLVTAGTNVPTFQPLMVYAGPSVIAFSSDYVSNIVDPFTVYYDPDAPAGEVSAPKTGVAIAPGLFTWPDTLYETQSGNTSPAELIYFRFAADTSTSRDDDYLLLRGVNNSQPEVISRGILRTDSEPFLRFFVQRNPSSAMGIVDTLAASELPLAHVAKLNNTAADTGQSALIDSIRAVRVTFSMTNMRPGDQEVITPVSRLIAMQNLGFMRVRTCGDEPILGVSLGASAIVPGTGEPNYVQLSWLPAVDENSGESDVMRYVIYRRIAGVTDWGDPYQSIPAGLTTYTFNDEAVVADSTYQYSLAAQDCTPTMSPRGSAVSVTVPS